MLNTVGFNLFFKAKTVTFFGFNYLWLHPWVFVKIVNSMNPSLEYYKFKSKADDILDFKNHFQHPGKERQFL